MKDQLNTKLNDYSTYVNRAVKNFKEAAYSDSAINSRKAAEAACKLIIYNAFSQKMAEDKINDKTLRELITQLIKDKIAERKAINHIETLQIIGNKAAHDNVIIKDEAAHCLNALSLLSDYLFTENLKIAFPSSLNFDFETKKEAEVKQPEIIEKIIVQEKIIQQKIDKETEEAFFKKIESFNQDERGKYEALLDQKQQQLYETNQKQEQERTIKERNLKTKNRRVLFIVLAGIIITGLIVFFIYNRLSNNTNSEELLVQVPINKHPDSIYVAINSLDILQDNPQMDFKIERYLSSYMNNIIRRSDLPIKITQTNFKIFGLSNKDSIITLAGRIGYEVVFFGDFYESSLDSSILEINGHFVKDRTYFRDKRIKFKNLTDSSFIKEINDQANLPVMLYAISNDGKAPYPEIIKALSALTCYSKENYNSIKGYMASLQLLTRDYQNALKIFNVVLKTDSSDSNILKLKATALRDLNMLDSSQIYFDKALKNDKNNTYTLIQYAYLVLLKNKKDQAKEILNKVISLDANNVTAKKWLSQLNFNEVIRNSGNDCSNNYATGIKFDKQSDYKAALKVFNEVYLVDPNYKDVKARMAKCYFNLGDKINAMKFGRNAVLQDSTDITSTFFYASLLAQVMPENKKEVMRYYDLSVKNDPQNLTMLQMYAEYLCSHTETKRCIEVCELAKRKYPYDTRITRLLGTCYIIQSDYRSAKPYYEFMCRVEPDNAETMVILANCYLNTCMTPNDDFKKGVKYINNALALNPKNGVVQLVYARYMQRLNQLAIAKEHYLKAKEIDKGIKDSNLETLLR